MKKIKIKFIDFYPGFKWERLFLSECLEKHYEIEFSDDPEYLFFSGFGLKNLEYSNCVKIFCTGENQTPDFNLCDYAIGYDWLEFGDRYFRAPTYYHTGYRDSYEQTIKKIYFSQDDLEAKQGFCSFVYSNGNADGIREQFFHKLSEYKKVDSGGRFLNNSGGPCESKYDFESAHKFSIAFENTAYPGYTTEKLLQSFAAHTIPIYWGDPTIEKVFNPKSFIHVRSFDNLNEVVKRVRELDESDEQYMEIMRQPAIINDDFKREAMMVRLEEFLGNIIEQDPKQAKRFSRDCWNKNYIEKQIVRRDAYEKAENSIHHKIEKKVKRYLHC